MDGNEFDLAAYRYSLAKERFIDFKGQYNLFDKKVLEFNNILKILFEPYPYLSVFYTGYRDSYGKPNNIHYLASNSYFLFRINEEEVPVSLTNEALHKILTTINQKNMKIEIAGRKYPREDVIRNIFDTNLKRIINIDAKNKDELLCDLLGNTGSFMKIREENPIKVGIYPPLEEEEINQYFIRDLYLYVAYIEIKKEDGKQFVNQDSIDSWKYLKENELQPAQDEDNNKNNIFESAYCLEYHKGHQEHHACQKKAGSSTDQSQESDSNSKASYCRHNFEFNKDEMEFDEHENIEPEPKFVLLLDNVAATLRQLEQNIKIQIEKLDVFEINYLYPLMLFELPRNFTLTSSISDPENNLIEMSPSAIRALGINDNDMVSISSGDRTASYEKEIKTEARVVINKALDLQEVKISINLNFERGSNIFVKPSEEMFPSFLTKLLYNQDFNIEHIPQEEVYFKFFDNEKLEKNEEMKEKCANYFWDKKLEDINDEEFKFLYEGLYQKLFKVAIHPGRAGIIGYIIRSGLPEITTSAIINKTKQERKIEDGRIKIYTQDLNKYDWKNRKPSKIETKINTIISEFMKQCKDNNRENLLKLNKMKLFFDNQDVTVVKYPDIWDKLVESPVFHQSGSSGNGCTNFLAIPIIFHNVYWGAYIGTYQLKEKWFSLSQDEKKERFLSFYNLIFNAVHQIEENLGSSVLNDFTYSAQQHLLKIKKMDEIDIFERANQIQQHSQRLQFIPDIKIDIERNELGYMDIETTPNPKYCDERYDIKITNFKKFFNDITKTSLKAVSQIELHTQKELSRAWAHAMGNNLNSIEGLAQKSERLTNEILINDFSHQGILEEQRKINRLISLFANQTYFNNQTMIRTENKRYYYEKQKGGTYSLKQNFYQALIVVLYRIALAAKLGRTEFSEPIENLFKSSQNDNYDLLPEVKGKSPIDDINEIKKQYNNYIISKKEYDKRLAEINQQAKVRNKKPKHTNLNELLNTLEQKAFDLLTLCDINNGILAPTINTISDAHIIITQPLIPNCLPLFDTFEVDIADEYSTFSEELSRIGYILFGEILTNVFKFAKENNKGERRFYISLSSENNLPCFYCENSVFDSQHSIKADGHFGVVAIRRLIPIILGYYPECGFKLEEEYFGFLSSEGLFKIAIKGVAL